MVDRRVLNAAGHTGPAIGAATGGAGGSGAGCRPPEELESERTLEEQLAVLEALLDRLREADPITGVPDSLAADLEAAREICQLVDGLIEAKEWGL